MDLQKSEPIPEDLATARPETEVNENSPDSSINTVTSCLEVHAKAKRELADTHRNLIVEPSPLYDAKLGASGTLVKSLEISANCSSENVKVSDVTITASEVSNSNVEDVGRRSGGVNIQKDRVDGESSLNHCQPNHDLAGLDGSLEANKISEGFALNSGVELSKSSLTGLSPRVASGESKVIASVGNSSSASSTLAVFASDNCVSARNQNHNTDSKLKGMPESRLAGDQDNDGASTEVVKDEGRHERPRKLVKELSKSTLSSVSKSSQLKKFSHASVSKRTLSDLKDSMLHSSSLPSPVHHPASNPASDSANVLQTENALNIEKKPSMSQTETASSMQKKVPGSFSSQKGEKTSQSVTQCSSKVNTTLTHAAVSTNSPATLSDEEVGAELAFIVSFSKESLHFICRDILQLALLLHQELNSSPRVPRVPRMRHAGSLPQLASPTATSTLMKRTSSTGGKDHGLVC